MKKRFLLVLTDAEIGHLRAALQIQLDSGEVYEHDAAASVAAAYRAVAKIDAARKAPVDDNDLAALDLAAGDLIDGDDWEDYTRGRRVSGNPRRARAALAAARRRP